MKWTLLFIVSIGLVAVYWVYYKNNEFVLSKGDNTSFVIDVKSKEKDVSIVLNNNDSFGKIKKTKELEKVDNIENNANVSTRQIFITDGVKHSVPLDEIIGGGPPKDGIPSIDEPVFISIKEADKFLNDDSIGLGFVWKGEARFYPYQILVWHEIVNDEVKGDPVLISYCPLCATAIVFERKLDGEIVEFGTSGKLWKSNLVMYNRSDDPKKESLWSQLLGEGIVGEYTGEKLKILPADTLKYGDWKNKYKDTKVLSRDTGAIRSYGVDPYGDYYTDSYVSFGATFNDDRLHPKDIVLGIKINGKYKAYKKDALSIGVTEDIFNGVELLITMDDVGQVRIINKDTSEDIPIVAGFWFAWLAIHPDTELYLN